MDVNWAPLSNMMVAEIPNRETQPAKRALARLAGVMEKRGMAFSHHEVSVNFCEQVSMAAGGWEQLDQVNVDVGETAVRYWYLCWL